MCEYTVDDAEISINTSCEHITQEQYERWLSNQNDRSLIILQSNNFFELEEHIRCSTDIDEFIAISKIEVIYADTLVLPKYNRFMIIGRKNSNLAI
jgi:hypothetical protein